jgi:hypothetical protein
MHRFTGYRVFSDNTLFTALDHTGTGTNVENTVTFPFATSQTNTSMKKQTSRLSQYDTVTLPVSKVTLLNRYYYNSMHYNSMFTLIISSQ